MRRVLRLLVVALVAATGLALCPGSAAGASCANQTTTALPGAWISISLSCPMTGPAAIVTPPQHGTLTIGASDANGVWLTYRSDSAYRGVDTFSFSGPQEGTVTHTVKLEAPPLQCSGVWQPYGSPPPIPARDGSEVPIGVTCANLVYGDQLELELTPPAHGTVRDTSLGTDLGFRYRSTPGYVGPDTVTVRVVSPLAGRSSAPFEIPIAVKGPNRPPFCPPVGTMRVAEGATRIFPNLCGDPDGDPLSYGIAALPASGWLSIGPDGAVWYTARPGFRGTDTLKIVVGDGFAEATIDIPVAVGLEEPPAPQEPGPPAPPQQAATQPPPTPARPPEGFRPATQLDALGDGVAAFVPAAGLHLGKRFEPVVGASCATACTLGAQVTLHPRRHAPIALPPQTLPVAAGRRGIVRLRLPREARKALHGRAGVRVTVTVTVTPEGGQPRTDTLTLWARVGPRPAP